MCNRGGKVLNEMLNEINKPKRKLIRTDFLIEPEVNQKLDELSRELKVPKSMIMRFLLREALNNLEKELRETNGNQIK
jgi:predicted DNA-binding protein